MTLREKAALCPLVLKVAAHCPHLEALRTAEIQGETPRNRDGVILALGPGNRDFSKLPGSCLCSQRCKPLTASHSLWSCCEAGSVPPRRRRTTCGQPAMASGTGDGGEDQEAGMGAGLLVTPLVVTLPGCLALSGPCRPSTNWARRVRPTVLILSPFTPSF